MGGAGFEPAKSEDNRFTVCPSWPLWYPPKVVVCRTCLRNGLTYSAQRLFPRASPRKLLRYESAFPLIKASGGIRTHDRLITNQLLYQLSYTGVRTHPTQRTCPTVAGEERKSIAVRPFPAIPKKHLTHEIPQLLRQSTPRTGSPEPQPPRCQTSQTSPAHQANEARGKPDRPANPAEPPA